MRLSFIVNPTARIALTIATLSAFGCAVKRTSLVPPSVTRDMEREEQAESIAALQSRLTAVANALSEATNRIRETQQLDEELSMRLENAEAQNKELRAQVIEQAEENSRITKQIARVVPTRNPPKPRSKEVEVCENSEGRPANPIAATTQQPPPGNEKPPASLTEHTIDLRVVGITVFLALLLLVLASQNKFINGAKEALEKMGVLHALYEIVKVLLAPASALALAWGFAAGRPALAVGGPAALFIVVILGHYLKGYV